MPHAKFQVAVGSQVYLDEGGEEVGAVREVGADYVVVYVEGTGDFTLSAPEIHSAHDGKLVLEKKKLAPALLEAVRHAHEREDS